MLYTLIEKITNTHHTCSVSFPSPSLSFLNYAQIPNSPQAAQAAEAKEAKRTSPAGVPGLNLGGGDDGMWIYMYICI